MTWAGRLDWCSFLGQLLVRTHTSEPGPVTPTFSFFFFKYISLPFSRLNHSSASSNIFCFAYFLLQRYRKEWKQTQGSRELIPYDLWLRVGKTQQAVWIGKVTCRDPNQCHHISRRFSRITVSGVSLNFPFNYHVESFPMGTSKGSVARIIRDNTAESHCAVKEPGHELLKRKPK